MQQLYHKGLVNRFAFMRGKNPSEFYYYLDNPAALDLLVLNGVEEMVSSPKKFDATARSVTAM